MSLAMLIPGFVGIEAYQIVCRAIANGEASDDDKRVYGTFTLAAGCVAFLSSFAVLTAMRWPWLAVLLGAAVIATEHVGNELFRILLAEGRRLSALQCFSIRSGLWSLGLPILAFSSILQGPWSLELVLFAWLVAGVLGLFYALTLPATYRPSLRSLGGLRPWLSLIWKSSAAWLAVATAWKFIDSGPRLVAGIFLTAAEAGRFTFLNTIGSIPTVVIKGIVEPMFFVELTVIGNVRFRQRYFGILLSIGLACFALSGVLLFGYAIASHKALSTADWMTFVVLSLASVMLNLSQAPHFVLYANRHDRLIFYVSIIAVALVAPISCLAAWRDGRIGLAVSTLVMAVTLLVAKWISARWVAPAEFRATQPPTEPAMAGPGA
jgi:O-antigen/teichoic acid export membrane protein